MDAVTDKLLTPTRPEHPLQPVLDSAKGEIIPAASYFELKKSYERTLDEAESAHHDDVDDTHKASETSNSPEDQDDSQMTTRYTQSSQYNPPISRPPFNRAPSAVLPHLASLHTEPDDFIQRHVTRYGAITLIKELSQLLAEKEAELDQVKEQLNRKTPAPSIFPVDEDHDGSPAIADLHAARKVFASDAVSIMVRDEDEEIHDSLQAALAEDVFVPSDSPSPKPAASLKPASAPLPTRQRTDSNASKASVSEWMPGWLAWKKRSTSAQIHGESKISTRPSLANNRKVSTNSVQTLSKNTDEELEEPRVIEAEMVTHSTTTNVRPPHFAAIAATADKVNDESTWALTFNASSSAIRKKTAELAIWTKDHHSIDNDDNTQQDSLASPRNPKAAKELLEEAQFVEKKQPPAHKSEKRAESLPRPSSSSSADSKAPVVAPVSMRDGLTNALKTHITMPIQNVTNPPQSLAPMKRTNVKLETIVPFASQPPTYRIKSDGVLTDRYGFIYDSQSGRKLLRSAAEAAGIKPPDEEVAIPAPDPNDLSESVEELSSPTTATFGDAVHISAATAEGELDSKSSLAENVIIKTPMMTNGNPPNGKTLASADTQFNQIPASSVQKLLSQLMDAHESAQTLQQEKWDSFLKRRREAILSERRKSEVKRDTGSESTAKMLSHTRDDSEVVEEDFEGPSFWNDEGLIGITSMKEKEDWKEFKKLIRDGVPVVYRPKVGPTRFASFADFFKIWCECSGAYEVKEPGYFEGLLSKHENDTSACLSQIDVDVRRTMPNNIFFGGDGPGVEKLRRVLVAYSWHNPTVGYCQGMNMLAATLLLTHATEEDAFWVLICIIERILPSDYYTSQLLVSQADQRVLGQLTKELLPKLHSHLQKQGVDLAAITFAWFLSIFTDCLPVETLFRVWDVFFVEGMTVLFRVAIAILKMSEKELLKCDSGSALYRHFKLSTTHMYQVDKLMKLACDTLAPVIKPKKILKARENFVAIVRKELGDMDDWGEDAMLGET